MASSTDIPVPDYQQLICIPFVYNLCKKQLEIHNKYILFRMNNTMYLNTPSSGFPLEYKPSRQVHSNNITKRNDTYSGIEFILNAYHLYIHYYNEPYESFLNSNPDRFIDLTFNFPGQNKLFDTKQYGDVIGLWRMFIQQNAPLPEWMKEENIVSLL